MVSKERRLIKKLSSPNRPRHEGVASGLVLPNNSGDHGRGIKREYPYNDYDIANKVYVDDNVAEIRTDVDLNTAHRVDNTQAHSDYLLNNADDTTTGNLTVSKADPEIRLTDTGNSEYTRITKSDTTNTTTRYNRVLQRGNCINLNGTDEYITTNFRPSDASSIMSYGCWIKTTTTSDSIFGGATAGGNDWVFDIDANGKIHTNYRVSGTHHQVTTTNAYNDGEWHLCIVTVNLGGDLHLYVDDAEDVSVAVGSTAITMNVDGHLGAYNNAGAPIAHFNGRIDEFFIFTRVLTSGEVGDIYNSGNGWYLDPSNTFPSSSTSVSDNLWLLYHLDESTGTTADDASSNEYDGTVVNGDSDEWGPGKVGLPNEVERQVWKSSDNDTLVLGDTDVEIIMKGPVIFPSYTTSARDTLDAQNGMVIYNSTTNALNCYENGSWVDL